MKTITVFASMILAISIVACGGSEQDASEQNNAAQTETEQAPAPTPATPEMMDGVQVITVAVHDTGYSPAHIAFKAGVPAKIIFDQYGTTPCAWDVKSPALGIELTEIPKATKKAVEFTPTKGGTYSFTCGMDMLRGSIIVQES